MPGSEMNGEEHGLTAAEVQKLSRSCMQAKDRAYCPYSHFRVGAAILTSHGAIVLGANVENAAYPVTNCAERVALGTAVATHGMKPGELRAIAVATDLDEPCSPCGMCRQALREFGKLSMPLLMHSKSGKMLIKTLDQMLPLSFGPETLPPPDKLTPYHRGDAT